MASAGAAKAWHASSFPTAGPFSSQSPNNPYATQAPLLFGD